MFTDQILAVMDSLTKPLPFYYLWHTDIVVKNTQMIKRSCGLQQAMHTRHYQYLPCNDQAELEGVESERGRACPASASHPPSFLEANISCHTVLSGSQWGTGGNESGI